VGELTKSRDFKTVQDTRSRRWCCWLVALVWWC